MDLHQKGYSQTTINGYFHFILSLLILFSFQILNEVKIKCVLENGNLFFLWNNDSSTYTNKLSLNVVTLSN